MCMMDLWIGQHTVASVISTGLTGTWKRNPNRLALIYSASETIAVVGENGSTWYRDGIAREITGYTTTDTNDVPPTPSTGTITASVAQAKGCGGILHVKDYGELITQSGSYSTASTGGTMWELCANTVLAEYLDKLNYAQGYPFTSIVPPR